MDQYSQNPAAAVYSRAPAYSPFQNPAHVDDTFGYLANMYGPMLVEGLAGPDAFLAHQTPSQALSDQYMAARYQRQSVQSISAANTRGNEQVANKILGINSLLNGGQPITQLDRENANVGAAVVNNPLFKQFGAAMIGAENLEGLMFGRRGDPTALAAAVNRMGYYRQDATGNRRMSAESQQQFSAEMYENMFGEGANINEMRGFGAVAAGTIAEDLFQRGMLPKSMGAMSAADRVKLISQSKRDDKTVSRLAEEFGHRDLMARDEDYANATAEEQKIMLADKLDTYKGRLNKTFTEIDKYRAGDPRAKSAEEIEQMDSYGVVANAVDAQRTSKTVKEYTGAIASIREIFGDSGRSNAPIQELIAALEQLSGGSMMNMSPGKMQQLTSGLRLAARETGRDLSAVAAGMEQSMAIGKQYGLNASTIFAGEAERLHTAQAFKDAGVYEKQAFGKLNAGQLEERQRDRSLRGDKSGVGRMLATMNRLVSENPEMFKGTKMEAAMQAYQRGETTFEYDGKKVNLAEMAGREGVAGLRAMAQESGAEQSQIFAYMSDASTEEYTKAGYAFKAQGYELQRNVSRKNEARMTRALSTDEFKAAAKPRGMSDEEFRKKNSALAKGFSYKITGIIMDETDGMSAEERSAHIEKRGKEELVKYFKSSAGGELNQRQAEAQAERYFNAMYGEDPIKRKAALNTAYAEISGVTTQRTGENIEAAKQLYNKKAQETATERVQQDTRRAERQTELSKAMGTESTLAQRMGEEFDALASGDDLSIARVLNVTSKDAMQQQYAPEMREGLVAAAKMYGGAIVTPEKIRELGVQAAKSPNSAAARQLKQMAGYDPTKKLNEEEQAGLVDRAVRRSAYTAAGATEKERAQNEKTVQRANMLFKAYNTGAEGDVRAASRAIAQEMLGPGADDKKIAAFSEAVLSGDQKQLDKQMQGGIFGGGLSAEQKERTRAISTALQDARKIGGLEKAGFAVDAKESLAAQDGPAAQLYEYKKAVNTRIRADVDNTLDNRALRRLKPADMSDEAFTAQRRDIANTTARALTNIVTDEMGGAEGLKPEERAKYMADRTKAKMAGYFAMQDTAGGTDEEKEARAAQKADKYFSAMFGDSDKAVRKNMEKFYDHGKTVAQERGLDTATGPQRAAIPVDSSAAVMAQQAGQKTYDYEKLGVPEKITAAQQKLVTDLAKDPEGRDFEAAMRDDRKRQMLLTLPDKDAVELFNKMTPEAQKRGLDGMKKFKHSMFRFALPKQQQQNLDRLHNVIANQDSGGAAAGVSSRNLAAAEIAQTDPMFGSGGESTGRDGLETIGGEVRPQGFSPREHITVRSSTRTGAELADSRIAQLLSTPATSENAQITSKAMTAINADRSSASGVAQMAGKQESTVNVNGTLVLQGLSEAVLQASGTRMEDTPGGGVPIDMGRGQGAYFGR